MRSVQSPKYLNGDAAEIAGKLVGHVLAGLPRLNAPHPGLLARIELAESAGIVRVASWPS